MKTYKTLLIRYLAATCLAKTSTENLALNIFMHINKPKPKDKELTSKFSTAGLKMLWQILPLDKRTQIVKLWALMILGTLLEILGVGLVLPVMAVIMQQDIASHSILLGNFLQFLGNPDKNTLIYYALAALITIYIFKNCYLAFLHWQQAHFVFTLQSELSQKLFSIYLKQAYTFHLQRNSAHLVRNMQGEMSLLINSTVSQYMLLFAELFVILGLFCLLCLLEPLGTIVVFSTLLIAGATYQKVTKEKIIQWGKERQYHEGFRVKHLTQGLGGAKDVKLLGREADFLNQYKLHTTKTMRINQRQYVIQQLPRLWLEILAILGLSLLIVSMLLQDKSAAQTLPILALFAAVSFRLMPSASRILSAFQQIRYSAPTLTLLHQELHLPVTSSEVIEKKLKFDNVIDINAISYTYPNAKKTALSDISLKIKRGELVGFIGESGSGKSTLIDLVIGLLDPQKGLINVDGIDIASNMRAWQNQIGYVPQTIFLTDDTLRKNIAFGLADDAIDDLTIAKAIKASQLEEFVIGLQDGVNTIVGERGVRLSGGQRQRIGIARALYHDPSVLVLDEATSALDVETEKYVMQAINALHGSKTILIVAHRLSTVENCDRVFKLNNGKLV